MTVLVPSRKLSLFVLLSLTDLALTFLLLGRQGGGAYECNPLAAWWLARWGWLGLVAFKAAIVLLVVLLTGVVSRQRPRAADRILIFGCAALLAVIIHSGCLMPRVYSEADHVEALQAQSRRLDGLTQRTAVHTHLIYDLGKDLAAGRRSLSEAIQILSDSEISFDSEWLQKFGLRFPSFSGQELLAIRLIEEALVCATVANYGLAQLSRELNEEFRSCFSRPAPRLAVAWDDQRIELE